MVCSLKIDLGKPNFPQILFRTAVLHSMQKLEFIGYLTGMQMANFAVGFFSSYYPSELARLCQLKFCGDLQFSKSQIPTAFQVAKTTLFYIG